MVTEKAETIEGEVRETPKVAEATQEPTPETLEAKAERLQAERDAEREKVKEKDRGNARLAKESKAKDERLADQEARIEALEENTFGTEAPEPLEGRAAYEQRVKELKAKRQQPPREQNQPAFTPRQAEAIGELKALARLHKVDFDTPPPELNQIANEVVALWEAGDIDGAVAAYEKGLETRATARRTKAVADAKTAKDFATMQAATMQRDGSPSTGEMYQSFTPQQIAKMSAEEYKKREPEIAQAQRDGRIK